MDHNLMKTDRLAKLLPYFQTTGITCGVVCAMMVRGALQGIELTRDLEMSICKELYSKRFGIVPVISLAGYLAREQLTVEAYHQDKHLFWDLLATDPIGRSVQEYRYQQAMLHGVTLFEPPLIDEAFLSREIARERLVICGTMYHGIRHAVLLYDLINGNTHLIDPIEGVHSLKCDEFIAKMQTFAGVWCISVGANE